MGFAKNGRSQPVESIGPKVARMQLGAALRELRVAAKATLDDAGEPLQRSAATISRLENGQVEKPRAVDVRILLDFYAASSRHGIPSGERERILALVEASREEEWYHPYRDVLASDMVPDHVRRFVEFETYASEIDSFQPDLVPGLLQTDAYASALTEVVYPGSSPEAQRRFVDFRLARQEALKRTHSPLEMHVVVGEVALRRTYGGHDVMREQLEELAKIIERPPDNVTVQIAPLSMAHPAVTGGPFVILSFAENSDLDLVYLEGRAGASYLTSADDLATYRRNFSELTRQVAAQDTSMLLIKEAIKALG